MTIEQYKSLVAGLPKASHEMEHVTNLGKILSNGVVLLATELQKLTAELRRSREPVDHQAIEAKRKAEREAKRARLQAELEELGGDDTPEAA